MVLKIFCIAGITVGILGAVISGRGGNTQAMIYAIVSSMWASTALILVYKT